MRDRTDKRRAGPRMTLGNMHEWACNVCHSNACRQQALIDVWKYPDETEVPSFRRRVKCGKCGGRDVDVRPNWKEQPMGESLTGTSGGESSRGNIAPALWRITQSSGLAAAVASDDSFGTCPANHPAWRGF